MPYPTDYDVLYDAFLDGDDAGDETPGSTESGPHASHHNNLALAIKRVQQELGLNPSGTEDDVAERIAAAEALIAAAQAGLASHDHDDLYYTEAEIDSALAAFLLKTLLEAKGDLIAATADETPARIPIGATGEVLTVDPAEPAGIKWATPGALSETLGAGIVDAKGDLIVASASDTPARLPVGADGEVLIAASAETLGVKWGAAQGAVTEFATGTQAAVLDTEHFLSSPGVAGQFELQVDTDAMTSGDAIELRVYKKAISGGTPQVALFQRFVGEQHVDDIIKISEAIANELVEANAVRFSLTQTDGVARSFPWTVLAY